MVESKEIKREEGIDRELFEFLTETDPEILKRFTPTVSKEEEDRFLNSDFTTNPVITYPSLINGAEDLESKRELLLSTGSFLIQSYIDSRGLSVNDREELLTYYWDFVKRRSEIFDLLHASAVGDFSRFNTLAESLYGNPSIEIFNTYLRDIYRNSEKIEGNHMLSSLALAISEVLPAIDGEPLETNEIDLERFRAYLKPKMQSVIDILVEYPESGMLNSLVIQKVFEQALVSIGAQDWTIALSDEYKAIAVKGDEKTVYIPSERKVSKNKLLGLLAHEIYTHVQRRISAEGVFPYEILRTGLNGYLEGEEAIATVSEMAFNPDSNLDLGGGDMHFATCLALGVDGHKRDFKEVFRILYAVKKFNNVMNGKEMNKADEDAKRSAWKITLRVFRGTPGTLPGICFRKDLANGEGRVQLMRYLGERKDEDISNLWEAKYSPWKPTHMKVRERY